MRHWKLLIALGIAGVAAFLTGGCASTYTFKVDAINNPEVEELYSYKIVSTNPEASEEDLEFKEAAEYIRAFFRGFDERSSFGLASTIPRNR